MTEPLTRELAKELREIVAAVADEHPGLATRLRFRIAALDGASTGEHEFPSLSKCRDADAELGAPASSVRRRAG